MQRQSDQPPEDFPQIETATPMWPIDTQPDGLAEDAHQDPAASAWLQALASQGQATMRDHLEEQLYTQAPDALRQAGIEPTEAAIEDWVTARLRETPP